MPKVLLATDADWIFDEVDAALGDADTDVYRVRQGRHVLAAVRELEPDLVVLDFQIGNEGGVAASLELRQEQEMGRIGPVAILMLADRQADVFLAQIARSDGWLVKPVDSIRLRRAAKAVLDGGHWYEGMLEGTT